MIEAGLTYRLGAAKIALRMATHRSFESVFPRVNDVPVKILDRQRRYVRRLSVRLHPHRAQTLFALSACLRRQIFIPYAPISPSVSCREAWLRKRLRRGKWSRCGRGIGWQERRGNIARPRAGSAGQMLPYSGSICVDVELVRQFLVRQFLDRVAGKMQKVWPGNEHNLITY